MNTYDNINLVLNLAWLELAGEALGRPRGAGPMPPNAEREAEAFEALAGSAMFA